jgi:hypothetical protein
MELRGNGMGNLIQEEAKMVRNTVGKMGRNLERLVNKRLPVSASFNILERRAKTVEELVVIEVMREVYGELAHTQSRMAS